jgi:hypothetical protein
VKISKEEKYRGIISGISNLPDLPDFFYHLNLFVLLRFCSPISIRVWIKSEISPEISYRNMGLANGLEKGDKPVLLFLAKLGCLSKARQNLKVSSPAAVAIV